MKYKLMQTIQYKKSRIWEMKEDEYTISLAKNQVCAIFQMRDIQTNVIPALYPNLWSFVWKRHGGVFFQGHQDGGQKPTETSVSEFFY